MIALDVVRGELRDEPTVGGAKWSADLANVAQGVTIPTTYTSEVTDVSDGRYTIAVSYDTSFDTTIEGSAATGTISGSGSTVGSADSPLDVSFTVDQTMAASSGGVDIDVVVGIDVLATAA